MLPLDLCDPRHFCLFMLLRNINMSSSTTDIFALAVKANYAIVRAVQRWNGGFSRDVVAIGQSIQVTGMCPGNLMCCVNFSRGQTNVHSL